MLQCSSAWGGKFAARRPFPVGSRAFVGGRRASGSGAAHIGRFASKGMTTLPRLKAAMQKNLRSVVRQDASPDPIAPGQFLGHRDGPPCLFMRLACADGLGGQFAHARPPSTGLISTGFSMNTTAPPIQRPICRSRRRIGRCSWTSTARWWRSPISPTASRSPPNCPICLNPAACGAGRRRGAGQRARP